MIEHVDGRSARQPVVEIAEHDDERVTDGIEIRQKLPHLETALGHAQAKAVREEWVVEDRWRTGELLRRRYFELVLADGRDVVVFRELGEGRWYEQRG